MKSVVLIVILTVFCFGGSSLVKGAAVNYEGASTINFGTALELYYTSFRRIMPCGYPPLDIPVLAPFTLDYYSLNMTNGYYTILGNVSNFVVNGLNNFSILGGTYNITTNRTSFDLIYPEIHILGEYKMNAMAYLAGFPAKMAGSGLLNVKIIDIRLVGEFLLAPTVEYPDSLRISDFQLNFYLGDIIFSNWNMLWDISMNNFVNKMAREIMLMWVQQIQPQVDDIYAQLLLPNINGLLNGVSMTELIDFFNSLSMELNMANCTLA